MGLKKYLKIGIIMVDDSNNKGLCSFSTGWRVLVLPELRSIVDYKKVNPAINTVYFPNTQSSYYYWSSSLDVDISGYAWSVDFNDGYDASNKRSNELFVRLVRVEQ